MDNQQRILKQLGQINQGIKQMRDNLISVDDVSRHLRNAEFEILIVCDTIKKINQKEDAKVEKVRHAITG